VIGKEYQKGKWFMVRQHLSHNLHDCLFLVQFLSFLEFYSSHLSSLFSINLNDNLSPYHFNIKFWFLVTALAFDSRKIEWLCCVWYIHRTGFWWINASMFSKDDTCNLPSLITLLTVNLLVITPVQRTGRRLIIFIYSLLYQYKKI
jgi:hypothetical protein